MKIQFTVIAFLFFCTLSFGQTITYDYLSKKFELSKNIKSGDNVTIRVKNVNPFYFSINHKETLTELHPVPDNFFNVILDGFLANLNIKKADSIKVLDETAEETNKTAPCVDEELITELIKRLTLYSNLSKLYSELLSDVQNPYLEKDELENTIKNINDFSFLKNHVKTDEKDLMALEGLNTKQKRLLSAFYLVKSQYFKISKAIETENCTENNSLKSMKSLVDAVLSDENFSNISTLENLKRNAKTLIDNNKEDVFSTTLNTFKAKGDKLKVDITISPREQTKAFENYIQEITASKTFNIHNNFKISFSPGFFVTNNLNDQNYNVLTEKVTDSTNLYRIIKEDESRWNYGISALSHFTWNCSSYSVGFNAGFGFLPKDTKLTGLVGVTLIVGKKQQFLINGGISAAFSKTLSDALEMDFEYEYKPEIAKKEKLKTGYWIGIAYRL